MLADENVPRPAVEALIQNGHDVKWIRTDSPGISDLDVLAIAQHDERLLLTFDTDFAAMTFRDGRSNPAGLILFRLKPKSPSYVRDRVLAAVETRDEWHGLFATVRDDLIIIRRLGGAQP
ncbi:MAG: DUF5615 family PIN-like protein [Planctomycetota bacterium]